MLFFIATAEDPFRSFNSKSERTMIWERKERAGVRRSAVGLGARSSGVLNASLRQPHGRRQLCLSGDSSSMCATERRHAIILRSQQRRDDETHDKRG